MQSSTTDQKEEANDEMSDEEETQGWKDVKTAILFFTEDFLRACVTKGGPLRDDEFHGIFAFGTVVRFRMRDEYEAEYTYDPDDADDYPIHRVANGDEKYVNKYFSQNRKYYSDSLQSHPNEEKEIKTAYKQLFTPGYPVPGTDVADSAILPLATRGDGASTGSSLYSVPADVLYLCGVRFPLLDKKILTLTLLATQTPREVQEAHHFGRERRRYDYMFPRLVALISHELKITYFE